MTKHINYVDMCVLSVNSLQCYIKSYIVWFIMHVNIQFAFNFVMLFDVILFMHLKRSVYLY